MADAKFECWVDVPGTDGRFQVSNLGHLRMVGRKKRYLKWIVVEMSLKPKPLVCDYATGQLGWWLWFDMANHFMPREGLMRLFPEAILDVDRSADEEARTRKDATFDKDINDRRKAKTSERTDS